uniref:Ig-like domain-containing protein n=1 Tax=Sinocyclocheilus grahami TaxID=75366 RepID=A0A672QZR1_SINGR
DINTHNNTYLSVKAGDSVSISCTASSGIGYDMSWYLLRPGKNPKLLIYTTSNLASGVSDRFSGTYSGYEFTLNILQLEDEGEYYCKGTYSNTVWTFGGEQTRI